MGHNIKYLIANIIASFFVTVLYLILLYVVKILLFDDVVIIGNTVLNYKLVLLYILSAINVGSVYYIGSHKSTLQLNIYYSISLLNICLSTAINIFIYILFLKLIVSDPNAVNDRPYYINESIEDSIVLKMIFATIIFQGVFTIMFKFILQRAKKLRS